ncbi:MAG: ABC transporter substrate-binding protein [Candidatus Binatia bacterium]
MVAQKIAALLLSIIVLVPVVGATTLDEVIEGARKEAILRGQWGQNSYGGSEGFQEILAAMNKKYKLNLKGQYTPGPDMQRLMLRVIQEASAGQPSSTDVYLGNSQAIFDGLRANLFNNTTYDKFIENKPKPEGKFNAIAPAGTHVAFGTTAVGIQYNSNLVKGNDIPRRMADVLNPKWKGKIASTPYAAGLREFATPDFLGREKMIDYTKKLSKQIAGLMRCGESERITSGEFLMLVYTCGGNDVNVLKRTGAPVGHTVVEEGTVLHMRYAAIPKNSRAPNIGALLINYLMSAEGQEMLWKHDGMDLHLFPGSQTKRELDILRAAKGKIVTSSPEWLASSKNYAETQKELEGILREGGK